MVVFTISLVLIVIAIPIIALISAFTTGRNLQKRVDQLEEEIRKLRRELMPGTASGDDTAMADLPTEPITPQDASRIRVRKRTTGPFMQPAAPGVSDTAPRPVTMRGQPPPISIPEEAPAQTAPPQTAPAQPAPASSSPLRPGKPPARAASKPSRTSAEWEALLGGRVLNLVGAVALIIGVGFFLKYAFDNDWITEGMRAGIGAAIGIGLLLLGARSHKKKYEVFGQGLVGAGISVLYLTVFAAFALYDLGLSQLMAMLLMSGITALAFQQAFRYNSLAVSLLGLIGGFLTPVMLSTGVVNPVGLFSYLAILNAGLIGITLVRRKWISLEVLAFTFTHIYYFLWLSDHVRESPGTAAVFLGIFWVIFQVPDILRALKTEKIDIGFAALVGIANAVLVIFGMMAIVHRSHAMPISAPPAIVGCIYLLMMALLYRGTRGNAFIANRNAILGVAMLALAVWIHPFYAYDELYRSLIMTVLALVLFWWGAQRRMVAMWLPSLLLFGCALIISYDIYATTPLLTVIGLPLHAIAIAQFAVVAGLLVARLPAQLIDTKPGGTMNTVLNYAWPIVMFMALSTLTNESYRWLARNQATEQATMWTDTSHLAMMLCLVWIGYGLVLFALGLRTRRNPLLHCGLGSIVLASAVGIGNGLLYSELTGSKPVLNLRAAALLAIVAGLGLASIWIQKYRDRHAIPIRIAGIIQIVAVLTLLEFLTLEALDIFDQAVQRVIAAAGTGPYPLETITALHSRQQLTISGIWIIYSALLMVVGIIRRTRPLRVLAFVLFGFTILKIFIFDLSFLDTLYRIFSFIGLGVILLGISFLFQRFKDVIFGTDQGPGQPPPADGTLAEPNPSGTDNPPANPNPEGS